MLDVGTIPATSGALRQIRNGRDGSSENEKSETVHFLCYLLLERKSEWGIIKCAAAATQISYDDLN